MDSVSYLMSVECTAYCSFGIYGLLVFMQHENDPTQPQFLGYDRVTRICLCCALSILLDVELDIELDIECKGDKPITVANNMAFGLILEMTRKLTKILHKNRTDRTRLSVLCSKYIHEYIYIYICIYTSMCLSTTTK